MYHRVTLGFIAILVIFTMHSTWTVYKKKLASEKMMNVSLSHAKELENRSAELNSKMERISTVSGIEEEIRAKFIVAKEGENVVVVVDESKDVTFLPTSTFWQKIKAFFH